MPLPNFFVIGAPRAGTTAFYSCLKQHPDIYLSPVKEPRYFAAANDEPDYQGPYKDVYCSWARPAPRTYFMLFAGATNQSAVGEATTDYLESPSAARRIRELSPAARIIAILRQPAERAYSDYLFTRYTMGVEPAGDFAAALALETARRREHWPPLYAYRAHGNFFTNLSRYYELFPREQIRIYLYEDWKQEPRAVLRDVCGFLGVDDRFEPSLNRSNVSFAARNYAFHKFAINLARERKGLMRMLPESAYRPAKRLILEFNQRLNRVAPPPLDPGLRQELTESYREEVLRLQDLIGRDLSHWLAPAPVGQ